MNILRLLAELGLNAAPFNKGMDDAKKKSASSGSEIGAGFKRAFTQYLGAAVIIQTLRGIAHEIDNIEDSSQRLGVTTKQFQEMSIAADRAGQSLQGSKGIGKVFNQIAELRAKAEGGDIKASEQLHELGLSMLGTADASETMHDAFIKVINLTDSRLAEVFGGRVLLDIKAFREELAKMSNEAIFSDEQIKQVKVFDEGVKSLGRNIKVAIAEWATDPMGILKDMLHGQVDFREGTTRSEALPEATRLIAGIISGNRVSRGEDPNAAARDQRIRDIEAQIGALIAGAPRAQGRDMSAFIRESAGRYGLSRALIGTASQVEQAKPLNPELKKKLIDLEKALQDLKEESKKTIRFS